MDWILRRGGVYAGHTAFWSAGTQRRAIETSQEGARPLGVPSISKEGICRVRRRVATKRWKRLVDPRAGPNVRRAEPEERKGRVAHEE